MADKAPIQNKEISWLAFNDRVLQEAEDPTVPVLERLRYLAIFSNNLDEFFKVRVATLKRLAKLGKEARKHVGHDPHAILARVHTIILRQQERFQEIYEFILKELEREQIQILSEKNLTPFQSKFVENHFHREIRANLAPIMFDQITKAPALKAHAIYLAVSLVSKKDKQRFALLEVPSTLPRFVLIPGEDESTGVMLIDDMIRHNLKSIFGIFDPKVAQAYSFKISRDAELGLDDDLSDSLVRKVANSLERRDIGQTVRFLYDAQTPDSLLNYLLQRFSLSNSDSDLIPSGRYRNFKDFMEFPNIGSSRLRYHSQPPVEHPNFSRSRSVLKAIAEQEILLQYPYHSFNHVLDLLREASIDPKVSSIRVTLYRVAEDSKVINALINAAKNGKRVTVVLEIQARFDEEANIRWARKLKREGVRVIPGIAGYKVHGKLVLITRRSRGRNMRFACISTGNFHEGTARLYSDTALFTADRKITDEVAKVFEFLGGKIARRNFKHLQVSPLAMRKSLMNAINKEIRIAQRGGDAWITAKINNVTDPKIIKKLYQASGAGVRIRLMVRGMCSLVPGVRGVSENIEVRALIDRYLEHSRITVFGNAGLPRYFISSADWMPRNLDRRVEVTCPIYAPALQAELQEFLDIHWRDNVRARVIDESFSNAYVHNNAPRVRAQEAIYDMFSPKSLKLITPDFGQKQRG